LTVDVPATFPVPCQASAVARRPRRRTGTARRLTLRIHLGSDILALTPGGEDSTLDTRPVTAYSNAMEGWPCTDHYHGVSLINIETVSLLISFPNFALLFSFSFFIL